MKTNKKTLAILTAGLLAVTPMAATGLTAFASTLTIDNVTGDASTHQYKAYQIITGTKTSDVLTGLAWGSNVDPAVLITELKTFDATTFGGLTGASTVKEVADLLEGYADPEGLAKVFNRPGVLTGTPATVSKGSTNYSVSGLADGWYLVKDDMTPGSGEAKSPNLLQIVGDTTVTPKYSLPELTKKIVVDNTTNPVKLDDHNTADIGDKVDYVLTSVVPDMTGYDTYFFVINDKMADGLTFDNTSVHVYIDGTELVNGGGTTYYRIDEGDAAKVGNVQYTFQIVMNDFIQHSADKGKELKVTYSATLNSNADITTTGNPNKVFLTYSNNPNVTADGESTGNPDEPKPGTPPDPDTPDNPGDDYDDPVGVTPWSDVNTFTTAIKILKVDNDTNPLKGATFQLEGDGIAAVLKSSTTFTEDTSGTYYPLTNGTYTKTAPTAATADKYTGGMSALTYKETTTFAVDGSAASTNISGAVDDSGMLIFKGLGAGTYTLTETVTPAGYNTIAPITVNISNDKVADAFSKTNPNWKVTKKVGSDTPSEITATDNIYELQVINAKGSTLPTTGGIGTKLFYIIGSLLVAGSVVLLVTKKRMGVRED